jgi:hypothetical protein
MSATEQFMASFIVFSGTAAQRGLWPPLALQPSADYGLLWLCSPARAMASSGCAAQRGLWPPRSRGFLIAHNDAPQSKKTPVDEWSARRETSTSQHTTHTKQTNIHDPDGIFFSVNSCLFNNRYTYGTFTTMSPSSRPRNAEGFEATIAAGERP